MPDEPIDFSAYRAKKRAELQGAPEPTTNWAHVPTQQLVTMLRQMTGSVRELDRNIRAILGQLMHRDDYAQFGGRVELPGIVELKEYSTAALEMIVSDCDKEAARQRAVKAYVEDELKLRKGPANDG